MNHVCKSIGCIRKPETGRDFCVECSMNLTPQSPTFTGTLTHPIDNPLQSLSEKYPKYYKKVGGLTEVDVYAVHHLFNIEDPSGCIHHSSKKLLLSGVRTGGKSKYQDIKEARDTLSRWLELNPES